MKKKQTFKSLTLVSGKSLALALILGPVASLSVNAYELIDLGKNVAPKAINNMGVVVGASNTDQYPNTAFSWSSDGGFVYINGGTSANAVNDAGNIAGSTVDGAFIDNHQWSGYGAFGINQSGKVSGYKVGKNLLQPRSLPYNPAIFNGNKWDVYDIAQLYPRGTREDVYADRFILNGINTEGYTVGYKYRYGLSTYSAILIDPNTVVNDLSDVVYLPTYGGRAVGINDNKMIAGTTASNTRVTPAIYSRAFIYDYNVAADNLTVLPVLDELVEGRHSGAYDINENDEVVGYSESVFGNRAVIWIWDPVNSEYTIVDLNDMVPADTGWTLTTATAISDSDTADIVGTGTKIVDGVAESHGFLLTNDTTVTPPPPPAPIENQPPEAVASADEYSGKAPLLVSFNSFGSSDPDGTIVSYSWDFMDGSSSTEANPSHTFSIPDKYLVTLTVTDDQGLTGFAEVEITVRKGGKKQ